MYQKASSIRNEDLANTQDLETRSFQQTSPQWQQSQDIRSRKNKAIDYQKEDDYR